MKNRVPWKIWRITMRAWAKLYRRSQHYDDLRRAILSRDKAREFQPEEVQP